MTPDNDFELLASAFERARLPLRISERPFVRGVIDARIVQLDIASRRRRGRETEEIRLWPGEDSELRVLDTDPRLQQLVLLVHEPVRRFQQRIWDSRRRTWIENARTTNGGKRRFLVGMDERHLFIAELGFGVTTVADAHRRLQPASVRDARQRGTKVVRQGEWFFLPASDAERTEIALAARTAGIRRRARLWAGGRPHTASEGVDVGGALFVRGSVRHPDHATIHLRDWMRVERNTEVRGTSSSGLSRWVD